MPAIQCALRLFHLFTNETTKINYQFLNNNLCKLERFGIEELICLLSKMYYVAVFRKYFLLQLLPGVSCSFNCNTPWTFILHCSLNRPIS